MNFRNENKNEHQQTDPVVKYWSTYPQQKQLLIKDETLHSWNHFEGENFDTKLSNISDALTSEFSKNDELDSSASANQINQNDSNSSLQIATRLESKTDFQKDKHNQKEIDDQAVKNKEQTQGKVNNVQYQTDVKSLFEESIGNEQKEDFDTKVKEEVDVNNENVNAKETNETNETNKPELYLVVMDNFENNEFEKEETDDNKDPIENEDGMQTEDNKFENELIKVTENNEEDNYNLNINEETNNADDEIENDDIIENEDSNVENESESENVKENEETETGAEKEVNTSEAVETENTIMANEDDTENEVSNTNDVYKVESVEDVQESEETGGNYETESENEVDIESDEMKVTFCEPFLISLFEKNYLLVENGLFFPLVPK
jgi:hypothetical protein